MPQPCRSHYNACHNCVTIASHCCQLSNSRASFHGLLGTIVSAIATLGQVPNRDDVLCYLMMGDLVVGG